MAGLTTLTACPSEINAGDTLLFEISDSDFPASSWTLVYYFRGGGSEINATGTANGDKHLFNVSAATTILWMPGDYKGVAVATKTSDSTQAATIWEGRLTVNASLAYTDAGTDTRSWAKKCLDLIESVIQNKASKDVLNSTIAGQSIARMSPNQLFELRDRFNAIYQAELAQEQADQGGSQRTNIGITFISA